MMTSVKSSHHIQNVFITFLKVFKLLSMCLKNIYNSSELHEELLTRSNEVSIHQKHLNTLAK